MSMENNFNSPLSFLKAKIVVTVLVVQCKENTVCTVLKVESQHLNIIV